MSQLPVTALDLVVLGVVLLSALLAAIRGFTREVLAIASWGAAAVAAYVFHPMVLPIVKNYISNQQVALAAAIGGVFLLTLVIVSIITVKLSDLVLDSRIGALDRTLGFLFGAARGLLIAVIAFIFFDKLVGDKQQPEWVRDAKLRPVLKETGDQIIAFLPDDPEGLFAKWKAQRKNQGDPSEPPAAPGAPQATPPAQRKTENAAPPVYRKTEQQNLQQLIGSSASPAAKP